jgi:hypothetical protein
MIRDSGQVDRQMTGEVKELLDLFPWFNSAHLLLLKGLHNTGDIKFENQLKQSSIYIADREVLYYMLKKEAPHSEPAAPKVANEPFIQPEQIADQQIDNQQVVIETGRNSTEIIQELEKMSVFSGEAVNDAVSDPVHTKETVLVTAESDTDESASVVLVIDDGDTHIEETVIFMDPSINTSGQPELLELDEGEFELTPENVLPESAQPVSDHLPEERKKVQSELIDKFIQANPRIEPVRDKTDRPVNDLSQPFNEPKGELVTETLARIYISQGYYSRAIDIYEKLSLKYPEKSSYFATQIQKVKALIK